MRLNAISLVTFMDQISNINDDISETYPAQEAVALSEGWNDPLMDDYDDYERAKAEARNLEIGT